MLGQGVLVGLPGEWAGLTAQLDQGQGQPLDGMLDAELPLGAIWSGVPVSVLESGESNME